MYVCMSLRQVQIHSIYIFEPVACMFVLSNLTAVGLCSFMTENCLQAKRFMDFVVACLVFFPFYNVLYCTLEHTVLFQNYIWLYSTIFFECLAEMHRVALYKRKLSYTEVLMFHQIKIILRKYIYGSLSIHSSSLMWKTKLGENVYVSECVPEGGHTVAGGPTHDKTPFWVGASFTHLLHAIGCPHLTHTNLGLHFKMSGRPWKKRTTYFVQPTTYRKSPHLRMLM